MKQEIKEQKKKDTLLEELDIPNDWYENSGIISGGWSRNPIKRQKEYLEKGMVSETGHYLAEIYVLMKPPSTIPFGALEVEDMLRRELKHVCGDIQYVSIRWVRPTNDEENEELEDWAIRGVL